MLNRHYVDDISPKNKEKPFFFPLYKYKTFVSEVLNVEEPRLGRTCTNANTHTEHTRNHRGGPRRPDRPKEENVVEVETRRFPFPGKNDFLYFLFRCRSFYVRHELENKSLWSVILIKEVIFLPVLLLSPRTSFFSSYCSFYFLPSASYLFLFSSSRSCLFPSRRKKLVSFYVLSNLSIKNLRKDGSNV